MNPLIQLKQTTSVFLIAFGLACFGLSPAARAVTPAPDGGYPGENTAEGIPRFCTWHRQHGRRLYSNRFNAIGDKAHRRCSCAKTTSELNTAVGYQALALNLRHTGSNTAIGYQALLNNTTGNSNTAIGDSALRDNRTGVDNVAIGVLALFNNRKAGNTAIGDEALINNTTGQNNVALGDQAGSNLTTGSHNIDIGAWY